MEKCFTPSEIKKLKDELSYLEKEKRREVANKLKHAASFGDLSENSAYDDAKTEQSMLESQILKLRETLKEAKVVEKKSGSGTVQIGSKILVKENGDEKKMEIVGGTESDPSQGKISCESPLGKAFLNKKKGDVCTVQTPSKEKKFEILDIN